MECNDNKCSVIEFGKSDNKITGNYKLEYVNIYKTAVEKDLRIAITVQMSPVKHVNKITTETYTFLRNIRAAFTFLYKDMIRKLFVAII